MGNLPFQVLGLEREGLDFELKELHRGRLIGTGYRLLRDRRLQLQCRNLGVLLAIQLLEGATRAPRSVD